MYEDDICDDQVPIVDDADQVRDVQSLPDYDNEYLRAKTFLQKISPMSGDNLYDHLTECLNKILAERPENIIDFFEEYSRKIKEKRFTPQTDHLEEIYISPGRYELSTKLMELLKPPKPVEEVPTEMDPEDYEGPDLTKTNIMQLLYCFEQAGVGLPKTEMFCIELSMRKLAKSEPIVSIRFWGKIFGLYKNYIVLEAVLNDDEIEKRNTPPEEEEEENKDETGKDDIAEALKAIGQEEGEEEGEGGLKPVSKIPRPLPPLPVSQHTRPEEPPEEIYGDGCNKKVYYVCNEPGDPWIQLPNVTPKEIRVARQIVKYFTGILDTPISSFPKFPGTERNYLRAQIARISAGTQISPLGFYTFKSGGGGEEEEEEAEEEEEEGAGKKMKTTYNVNARYEGHPLNDLTDISMSFWVHHTLYILPQGRTQWWNPNPKEAKGEEEEPEEAEEEEEEGGKETVEPETGPALLTPLSEDASLEAVPPWSVRVSSRLIEDNAVAFVRSNLWPGAYAFSVGKNYENIYIGWGHKHYANNYSPTPMTLIQEEYPIGPEIMETLDPSAIEEEAWRIAHEPKPKPLKGEGEEEEEAEEEEEED